MISKHIQPRKDGISSALDAMRYGVGLKIDRVTGKWLDKSHRTRFENFGLIENGVYLDRDPESMISLVQTAAIEMQSVLDLNTRLDPKNKLAHFVFSFSQELPTEAALLDVEDSMRTALKLNENHFVSCLHNDNGQWHLHIFASRIAKQRPHRGNSLWRDRILRDRICREVEARHGMKRDNGFHEIDSNGLIVEVPIQERIARRELKSTVNQVSGRALSLEKKTGEQSFQSWCIEIRIGDRLKHSKSWRELHQTAAAYQCQIKQHGAGYVICPLDGKGSIQLSKLGMTNLSKRLGSFIATTSPTDAMATKRGKQYSTKSVIDNGHLFNTWMSEKSKFEKFKKEAWSNFKQTASERRSAIQLRYRSELTNIQYEKSGSSRAAARSVAKMEYAASLTEFSSAIQRERVKLKKDISNRSRGNNYKDYLFQRAQENDAALSLVRNYSSKESTNSLQESDRVRLNISAEFSGNNERHISRLPIKHFVQRNGSVIYDLGENRSIVDSSIANKIQLNVAAANDIDAVEIALRFAISKFGRELTLSGPQEFQKMVVETAVRNRLDVKFNDPVLEKLRADLSTKKNLPQTSKEIKHVNRLTKNQRVRKISRDR